MEEDKIIFNKLLGSAGLNKKEFSELTGLHYGSVANWGGKDKPVPPWVKSWIEYYIKAKTLDSVRGVICSK